MLVKLRSRIAVPYILLLLVGMVLLSLVTTGLLRNTFLNIYQQELLEESRLIGEVIGPVLRGAAVGNNLDDLAEYYDELLDVWVTLILPDGTVIGESARDRELMDNHYNRPEVYGALVNGSGANVRYSKTAKDELIYAASRTEIDGEVVGVVRLSIPVSDFDSFMAQVNRLIIGVTIGFILLATLISIGLTRMIAHPILELTRSVRAMADGHQRFHMVHSRTEELSQLSSAFYDMADQIAQQMETISSEKNRLDVVLEQMADGALIIDHSGMVEYINPSAIQILGADEDETVGYTFAEVVRHHQMIEFWRRCQENGEQAGGLVETSGEQGRFLQVIITPFEEAQRRGYLLILQDLTALRRLETIRRDFISNISHDLRTPISSMRLMTETLQDGAMEDPEAAKRFLDLMEVEIENMSQLVEELLELSRTQSGRVPLQIKPVPLASIIESAVKRLQPQADRAKLCVAVEIPQYMPMVMADSERVGSVITNLLHNAIKFTQPGGEIVVFVRKSQREAVVGIQDSGIGFREEDAKKIFDRFYKADRARSTGGMGIGLSIAKDVIEGHGGKIWAESKLNEGSTFYFTLPLARTG
ncbi:MAG: PAS domain-containing protein [Anaerolineaceae bacterium]|nr:PAS domain-containing protein [Anaerolineaceae bacterium]